MKHDIYNKTVRKHLTDLYLQGETSLAEERLLAGFYRESCVEKDEEAIAGLLAALPLPETSEADKLSDNYIEFDKILSEAKRKKTRKRIFFGIGVICSMAASVALVFLLRPNAVSEDNTCAFSPVEIVENLNTMANIDIFDMESMTAEPIGKEVAVTIRLKNNTTVSYLMSKDLKTGSIRMTALNNY